MDNRSINDEDLALVSDVIKKRLGLHFPPEKYPDLKRGIDIISAEHGFSDPSECITWILQAPLDRPHIESLAASLTVGETYFFREPQVFDLIERTILPSLISRRRKEEKYIRIWSTSCSTGEEAYSLGILVYRSIPDIKDWTVTILATDINPQALKKARDGIYSEWSFRSIPQLKEERYFKKVNNGRYEVVDAIKDLITFSYLNLVEDDYPHLLSHTNAMDLILCRNVLMYFSKEAVTATIEKLTRALVTGGKLVVSMTETMIIANQNLVPEVHDGITIFRKTGGETYPNDVQDQEFFAAQDLKVKVPVTLINFQKSDYHGKGLPEQFPKPGIGYITFPARKDSLKINDKPEINEYDTGVQLFESGEYRDAERLLILWCAKNPEDHKALALMAQVLANLGDLDGAQAWCRRAIAQDKLSPFYHHLLASILQEKGVIDETMKELRRALYADPSYIPAHFTLAHILHSQGKSRDSILHFQQIMDLLKQYEPDEIISGTGGMSAVSLEQNISSVLNVEALYG